MLLPLFAYLRSGRVSDLPLRLLILGGLSSLVIGVMTLWPHLPHLLAHGFLGVVDLTLVYVFILGLFFSLFAPLVIGKKNSQWVRERAGRAAMKAAFWFFKVLVMFIVNTVVLLLNLFIAAVSPSDVAPKAADAVSHFVERTADTFFPS